VALIFLLAPSLFDFTGTAAAISYFAGIAIFLMSLMTAFPLGAMRVIPFRTHWMIDIVMGLGLVVASFLPAVRDELEGGGGGTFLIVMGIAVLLTTLMTSRTMEARDHADMKPTHP
jgi:hypothetical protein